MSTYDKIWWLPICGGLTGIGLVLSYLAMRRRGPRAGLRAGLRGAGWSLFPLAAYLTGSVKMFWKMGAAIGTFAKGFVFSPEVWSGIAVAGLGVVLLLSTGGVRRRKVGGDAKTTAAVPAGRPAGASTAAIAPRPDSKPAKPAKPGKAGAGDDDDMKDIEEILRRRGIS